MRGAVFAAGSASDFAAERVGEPLHAVADAEYRDAEVEDLGVADGSVGVVNRTGASGEHYAYGLKRADFF